MTNNLNHNKNRPGITPEIMNTISGTNIAWNKTREEIWPEILAKIEAKALEQKNEKVISRNMFRFATAALIATLAVISSVMFFYTKTIKTESQNIEAFLPDNSRVILFAHTTLTYKPFLWKFSRTVKLKGESFFEVQKGQKFEVVSKRGKTIVLGTRFTVFSRNNEYNVTCKSGKVKLVEFQFGNEVIIIGGQEALLKDDGNFVIIENRNSNRVQADQSKGLIIEDELNSVLTTPPLREKFSKVEESRKENIEQKGTEPIEHMEKSTKQSLVTIQEQNIIPEAIQSIEPLKTADLKEVRDREQMPNSDKTPSKGTDNAQVKDKFRNSLTPEQIKILENQQLSKEEKRKAFLKSLSSEQKQLLKEQSEYRERQEINKTPPPGENMKEQQKSQVREQMQENSESKNMELQRQHNRKENENVTPGGGNSTGGDNSKPGRNIN